MSKKILLLGLIMLITIFVTGCFSVLPATGLAPVNEIEIVIFELFPVQIDVIARGNLPDPELFPVQIDVIARGNLPDPCTEISEVLQEREGNTFFVTIKTYRPPGLCIQVLAPFEVKIPLNVYGLPAGTYTVDVNGVQDTFDLEVDPVLVSKCLLLLK